MKKYTAPAIEITKFITEDIITTSATDSPAPLEELPDAAVPQLIDTQNLFNYD